jgi:uncharacterized protein (DUF58 family)
LEQDVNSESVREYVPGDSFRKIHWPTTARKNEIFVREFEHSPSGDWWVVLDLDQNVQVGEGVNATHEHAIILGASLTDLGMQTGRSIALAAHGKRLLWHRSGLSDEHKWNILRSLALVETGDVPLESLLEVVRPALNRKVSLIVITPAIKGEWLSSLLALRRLGVVPTVLLFDTQSFGGEQKPIRLVGDLQRQGIHFHLISKGLLDSQEANPIKPVNRRQFDSMGGFHMPDYQQKQFSGLDFR